MTSTRGTSLHPSAAPPRLSVPRPPTEPPKPSFPILASIAPVVGSLVLFAVTRSPYSLVFAALGPVIAVASLIDATWARRRRGRRADAAHNEDCARLRSQIESAHDAERDALHAAWPSGRRLAGLPDGGPGRWRCPAEARTLVTLGRGSIPSALQLSGAEADPSWTAAAGVLDDAPVVVDLADGLGIVAGPVLARAIARNVVAQIAQRILPRAAAFGVTPCARLGSASETAWAWLDALPHALVDAASGLHIRLAEGWSEFEDAPDDAAGRILSERVDGTQRDPRADVRVPSNARRSPVRRANDAFALVALSDDPRLIPPACRYVLTVRHDGTAVLVDGSGAEAERCVVPGLLAHAEAAMFAEGLADHARRSGVSPENGRLPDTIRFADLPQPPALHGGADGLGPQQGSLSSTIGAGAGGPIAVDLVADGPHALVGGTTGSGKSELLLAWVTGVAAGYAPSVVTFLLVDFKGGSSFRTVERLPHVVGVVTDLDALEADRVIQSLRAEIRTRERAIADAGARDVDDERLGGRLARLVVVVDEFQAVLDGNPELHAVFADLAARGRSLGMHLILCSQRPAAVARDGILANCTLRLSLRVNSRQDSIATIGSDAAAALSGAPPGRCLLAVEDVVTPVQVAVVQAADVDAVCRRWRDQLAPRRPWFDPLPNVVPLEPLLELLVPRSVREAHRSDFGQPEHDARPADPGAASFPLGLLDLPEEQEQRIESYAPAVDGNLLVLGTGRAGRTTALDTIEAGAALAGWRVHRVDEDLEAAWTTITALADPSRSDPASPGRSSLLLIDDVDAMLARAGDDHGPVLRDAISTILRDGPRRRLWTVLTAQRSTGPVGQFASFTGSRIVLRLVNRQEHVLVGEAASSFNDRRIPGRALWRGHELQLARARTSSNGTHDGSTNDGATSEETANEGTTNELTTLKGPRRPGAHAAAGRSVVNGWSPVAGRTTVLISRSPTTLAALLEDRFADTPVRIVRSVDEPASPDRALRRGPGHSADEAMLDVGPVTTIVLTDPETWLAGSAVLGRSTASDLVLHACTVADHRQVTRRREVPPLLGHEPFRAWLVEPSGPALRIDLAMRGEPSR
ncbi:FtsK/SpoIIIE domain-containing protein [Plantibacter sp. YIM 135249]|uniref:FtsK/SpoIIIE domain-containing protein n=1 Tax=Plantibacter sp. YIM 135249 TaxID=3423918 RepID=UPI003D32AA0A